MRLKTSFGDQSGFSSDTGWGCMIRSGQSLLANALIINRLGRGRLQRPPLVYGGCPLHPGWLTPVKTGADQKDPGAERAILSQFADDPRAPYSLHCFVNHGSNACGKYPGEWFGPSATARCIQFVPSAFNETG